MLTRLKEEFIEYTSDQSRANYSRKNEVFIEYLEKECGANEKNFREILSSIGANKILDSIDFYVHNYGIKYKSTVDNYITALKSFFIYLSNNYGINNSTFDSNKETFNLDNMIRQKVKDLRLNTTEMKEAISEKEFNNLLKECDLIIESYDTYGYLNDTGKYKAKTGDFLSAIMIKLVMFTGIKNKVILTINKNDYNYDLNQIKINGNWINLPNKLSYDMKKYFKVREQILKFNNICDDDNKPLFIKPCGNLISKNNISGIVYKVMQKVIGKLEGESLCKYVIMNHIKSGMDILEIMNLTTFSIETCMNCREQLNIKLDNDRNRYINTRLRNSKLYELL